MISITLLGAGNLASHLYKAFSKSEKTTVHQWYNRTIKPLSAYENLVDITDDITNLKPSDLYVIAVTDDAIAGISQQLPFTDRLVVHTSGSVGLHAMDKKNVRGVFYPLQTFSKDAEIDFKNVPICVEGEHKPQSYFLKNIAEAIGSPAYKINTEQRQILHLSAVFVNNFTNQLYRIAHEISDAKSVNFEILKPLILETAKKVQHMSPYMAQTGPAKRNDKKTLKRHLKQLTNEDHQKLYELLTRSIQETHGIRYKFKKD